MTRWPFLLLTLIGAAATAAEKPNILFLVSDDMRPQLGCYGDKVVKSPNLDRLASQGLLFEQAFCQQALCSPSRISLLSGRRPTTTQIYTIGPTLRSTMPEITTLPQHFKNNGYFCRSLGKVYHVGIDDPDSWSVDSWISKKPRYGPEGQALVRKRAAELRAAGVELGKKANQLKANPNNQPIFAGPAFEAPDVGDEELHDGDTAREAVAAIKQLAEKPGQPFFLAVGFNNPHVPWVAPKKYFDQYKLEDIKLPNNRFVPKDAPVFAAKSGDDFYWYGNVPKDRKISEDFGKECLRGYLAAISYVDAQIGRILDTLEQTGLARNTVVIFWGDHGYYMGEHDWWGGKHNNYEGATRAPLIISVPGMKNAGAKTSGLVEFVDVYPSLAQLAGLPTSQELEGTSFVPLLDNPSRPWKKAAFSEYPKGGNQGTAMRTDRYRYVEWKNKKGELVARELYDHQADPQENRNVAQDPANAQVLDQLAQQMKAGWRAARP